VQSLRGNNKKGRQVQRNTLHRMRGQGNIKGP